MKINITIIWHPITVKSFRLLYSLFYTLFFVCTSVIILFFVVSYDCIFDKINESRLTHTVTSKHKINSLDEIKGVI